MVREGVSHALASFAQETFDLLGGGINGSRRYVLGQDYSQIDEDNGDRHDDQIVVVNVYKINSNVQKNTENSNNDKNDEQILMANGYKISSNEQSQDTLGLQTACCWTAGCATFTTFTTATLGAG